jgi:hypothetical protein
MNNVISLQQAIDMTTLFRDQKDKLVHPDLIGKDILATCETFDRAAFDQVLSQTGCLKLRIYSGLTPGLQLRTIIVGVNDKDEDMLPAADVSVSGKGDIIIEEGTVCPPVCPPPSPLNP